MDNFDEDPRDDFEVEYFDLPVDETCSISGQLSTPGSHLWMRVRSVSGKSALEAFRLLSMVRTWLLSEMPGNHFADGSSKDDIELEISDLPPARFHEVSSALSFLSSRLSPGKRIWRFVMVGCTVLLMLLLILGNFPPVRNQFYNLLSPFAHPTPVNQASFKEKSPDPGVKENRANSFSFSQATDVIWNTGATPGPAPQAQSCLASSVNVSSREVGSSPAWAVGFDGASATLHVSPISLPVSSFPAASGWAASIPLEIQSDYTGPITFTGGSQSDSSPLVFGFGLDPGQAQLFSITLSNQQPVISPNRLFKTGRTAWNITIYVPAAGCYFLKATWPGGRWIINFAAGQ